MHEGSIMNSLIWGIDKGIKTWGGGFGGGFIWSGAGAAGRAGQGLQRPGPARARSAPATQRAGSGAARSEGRAAVRALAGTVGLGPGGSEQSVAPFLRLQSG